jgi:hypothetical protein
MSKIKPFKAYINILNNGTISVEDLKAYDDALSGNEQAKKYLAKKLGVKSTSETTDSFFDEVDEKPANEQVDYQPEVPVQDPVAEIFAAITEENPEVAGKISSVYADLDDEFKREIYNPQVFPLFAGSVANGEFERLYPLAIKARAMNPALTWLQAYQMAGSRKDKPVEKKVTPPKGTNVPKRSSSQKKRPRDDYDAAFEMDLKELEAQLFG